MNESNIEFMRQLEEEFRRATGLSSRADYKIFYGQVFPAPILVFGINPGGSPAEINTDGTLSNAGHRTSASPSYYENNENDILDCE